jgi:hypothetical protein
MALLVRNVVNVRWTLYTVICCSPEFIGFSRLFSKWVCTFFHLIFSCHKYPVFKGTIVRSCDH